MKIGRKINSYNGQMVMTKTDTGSKILKNHSHKHKTHKSVVVNVQ